jgi:hypothetical protein
VHALCSSKKNGEMDGRYFTDSREIPKNGRMMGRIQMLKRPSISGLSGNWTRCTCQVSNVEKQVRRSATKLGHKDFKATDGWLSRWKFSFGIKLKKAQSKKDIADAVSAEQNLSHLPQIFS